MTQFLGDFPASAQAMPVSSRVSLRAALDDCMQVAIISLDAGQEEPNTRAASPPAAEDGVGTDVAAAAKGVLSDCELVMHSRSKDALLTTACVFHSVPAVSCVEPHAVADRQNNWGRRTRCHTLSNCFSSASTECCQHAQAAHNITVCWLHMTLRVSGDLPIAHYTCYAEKRGIRIYMQVANGCGAQIMLASARWTVARSGGPSGAKCTLAPLPRSLPPQRPAPSASLGVVHLCDTACSCLQGHVRPATVAAGLADPWSLPQNSILSQALRCSSAAGGTSRRMGRTSRSHRCRSPKRRCKPCMR